MAEDRGQTFSQYVAQELALEGKRRGVLQKDIAKAAGITPTHLSHVLAGRKGPITVEVLVRAAERVGVEPKEIVAAAYGRLVRDFGSAESAASTGEHLTASDEIRLGRDPGVGVSLDDEPDRASAPRARARGSRG